MPTVLSDADVFGQTPTAPTKPAPAAPQPTKQTSVLSDAEVFGSPTPRSKTPKAAKPAAKPEDRSYAREGFAVADLLTTGPIQMIADVFGQTVGRVVAGAQGASREEAVDFGKQFGGDIASHPAINQPLTKLFNWVSGHEPNSTRVDDAMGKVTEYIGKGGDWVEKKTGGAIKKEDVELMTEAIMAGAGGQVLRRVAGGKAEPKVGAPTPTPTEAAKPETPMSQAAKRDVKADIEATTGVAATKESLAQAKARREQARAAFKEDPQYADYLRNYADEEARLRSTQPPPLSAPGGLEQTGPRAPRTGLREAAEPLPTPKTPAQAIIRDTPPALDSALEKVRQGRAFDLTAEERIRLKNSGPTPKIAEGQRGSANIGDMAALAAFVGGAAAMHAWSDDPSLVSDIVAGLTASAATRIRPGALVDTIRSARNAKPLASIGDLAIEREGNIRLAGLDTTNTVRKVVKLVPDEAGREKVHDALDTGNTRLLSEREKAAYSILRTEYDRLGKVGVDAETLKSTRANYATHMWKMDADFFERLFGRKQGFGTSPNTPYAMHRMFATMAEGERAGLKPVSKDAAFVFATYANSLTSAVENGRLLKSLKEVKTDGGDLLLQKTSEAPPQYVTINNPQLRGMAVHPEIAPQMRFIFDNPSAAGVGAALEIIADVTKRSAVSASLFHAKALTDVLVAAVPGKAQYFAGAAIGAGGAYALAKTFGDDHALREAALGGIAGYAGPRLKAYATGRSAFLKELEQGSNSDFVKRAVKSGLVFGAEKGPLVVDDAGRRFYDAMRLIQQEADRIAQPVGIKAGKGVEAYIRANHWMDDMMWGRLHPAMKLEVWSKTSEGLRQASIERNARDPKTRILTQAEADQIASKYTNDMFGGLNWTRLAMEAQTRLGRQVAQEVYSPRGRRTMRISMFAPDWTLSTARAALAAIDKDLVNPLKWGNVAQGMFQPITRGDLARQYVARSALYYLVAGDAINYSMSGHHLWENEGRGWSFIDWGDGRWMQFSKHIMETPHWVEHPVKQAVGKLGYVPKEIANQALGTEYLAPSVGKSGQVFAGPRMKDPSLVGRVEHAAGGLMPIPFQSASDPEAFLFGFAGMPLYGKTQEQKEEAKREREEKKRRAE